MSVLLVLLESQLHDSSRWYEHRGMAVFQKHGPVPPPMLRKHLNMTLWNRKYWNRLSIGHDVDSPLPLQLTWWNDRNHRPCVFRLAPPIPLHPHTVQFGRLWRQSLAFDSLRASESIPTRRSGAATPRRTTDTVRSGRTSELSARCSSNASLAHSTKVFPSLRACTSILGKSSASK